MNHSTTRILTVAVVGAVTFAGASAAWAQSHNRAGAPIIITPPAIPDGSNFSRAPFPAWRPQNDVLPPTGEAFAQNLPPNTPSTNPDPLAPPPAAFAVLEPKGQPGLTPTGRPSTGASAALDPRMMDRVIRTASYDARDSVVDSVRVRMRDSEEALIDFRHTEKEMSPEGRSRFQAADDEARVRRKQLEHSARAAANASSANWEGARDQLAADYDAYASAVAEADSDVGVRPAQL